MSVDGDDGGGDHAGEVRGRGEGDNGATATATIEVVVDALEVESGGVE